MDDSQDRNLDSARTIRPNNMDPLASNEPQPVAAFPDGNPDHSTDPTIAAYEPAGELLPIGHILDGRFVITKVHGRGSMGVVYRAMELDTQLEYAVKVLAPELASDLRALHALKQEVARAASVNHQNLLSVKYFADFGPQKYIVMENVKGENLETLRVRRGGRLQIQEFRRIASQVLAGLDYLHSRGLVHLDVKPQNIMLALDGTVKIVDYGISRTIKEQLSNVDVMHSHGGTLAYMPSEQISHGGVCDRRADVYSVGMVFHLMLSGRHPFDAGSSSAALAWHLDRAHKLADVPTPGIATVIAKALDVDAAQRWASCRAFGDAIDIITKDSEHQTGLFPGEYGDLSGADGASGGSRGRHEGGSHAGDGADGHPLSSVALSPVTQLEAALAEVVRNERSKLERALSVPRAGASDGPMGIRRAYRAHRINRSLVGPVAKRQVAVILEYANPQEADALVALFLHAASRASAAARPEKLRNKHDVALWVAWRNKAKALYSALDVLSREDPLLDRLLAKHRAQYGRSDAAFRSDEEICRLRVRCLGCAGIGCIVFVAVFFLLAFAFNYWARHTFLSK